MRLRAGFVSNSSSTSFLIISSGELEEGPFLRLMGVAPDSPIAGLFRELFRAVISRSQCVHLADFDDRSSPEDWFNSDHLSPAMISRLRQAAGNDLKAYFGTLSSDNTSIQSFFCTDAFEVEDERIYFNYLQCVW